MRAVVAAISRLVLDEAGQDLIEYAMLAGLIAVVAIAAVTSLGNVVNNVMWQTIASGL
jgi:Flp pilus assembly pilin Flp